MPADPAHILVVDDDERLRDLLTRYLRENGFLVAAASSAADARLKMTTLSFDLLVLDLMMPGESGLEFADDIRKKSDIPILMLTAMAEAADRITGLEHGADDYLVKPFEPRELLLRINSILKRLPKPRQAVERVSMGGMAFDLVRGELTDRGNPVRLTDVESALLGTLAGKAGQILSREELIELTGAVGGGRAVDVQVTRLRRKIENNPKMPRYLQTVRGKGYVLNPD